MFIAYPMEVAMKERNVDPIASAAVNWAGGVGKLAIRIGCSHTTISYWLHLHKPLAAEWALLLQKASKGKFKAREIRPELF